MAPCRTADGMLTGRFNSRRHAGLDVLRAASLDAAAPFAVLDVRESPRGESADDLLGAPLAEGLESTGVVLVRLRVPDATAIFLAAGRRLGVLLPETDPAVQPFVQNDVLLHIREGSGSPDDPSERPFSRAALTLHSECSRRPLAEQPRYVALLCRRPPTAAVGGQTLLVDMASVDFMVSEAHRSVLSAVEYRNAPGGTRFRRLQDGRAVYSFRDPGSEPLDWQCTIPGHTVADVDSALVALITAMYTSVIYAVRWAPGVLLVLDNHRVFHGRSGAVRGSAVSSRHLERLRILDPDPSHP